MNDAHHDKRDDERIEAGLDVVVSWTGEDGTSHTSNGVTRNLSDGGALLVVKLDPAPPAGSEVYVRVANLDTQAPTLRAQITRYTEDGLALMFLTGGTVPGE